MSTRIETGLLILRVVLGITFLIHGINKFQMGIGNVVGWFESMGLPGFIAYATAIIELVGGAALIIGLGTRVVSVLFAIIMVGAIVKVKAAAGFLGNPQMPGYELDLVLLAVSASLAVTGSRLLAVDSLLFRSSGK
jgi:putative oxidoreductase